MTTNIHYIWCLQHQETSSIHRCVDWHVGSGWGWGPSYHAGPQLLQQTPITLKLLQSPTKLKLKPVGVVIRRNRKCLNQAGIGRLAICLARESVFGPDVMAANQPTVDGLTFIENTLQNQLTIKVLGASDYQSLWPRSEG